MIIRSAYEEDQDRIRARNDLKKLTNNLLFFSDYYDIIINLTQCCILKYEVETAFLWLKNNKDASVEEYAARQKELELATFPIVIEILGPCGITKLAEENDGCFDSASDSDY